MNIRNKGSTCVPGGHRTAKVKPMIDGHMGAMSSSKVTEWNELTCLLLVFQYHVVEVKFNVDFIGMCFSCGISSMWVLQLLR